MQRYVFAPRLRPMLFATVFFGGCLAFYAYRMTTNDSGLIINGVIELGREGATTFYAVFALGSLAFVMVGLAACFARLRGTRYVELDDDTLSVPARWTGPPQRVRYAAITSIQHETVSGQRMVHIVHGAGKLTLSAIMLESDAVLDEIAQALARRIEASRTLMP